MEEEIIRLTRRLSEIHLQRERLLKEEKEIVQKIGNGTGRSVRSSRPFNPGDKIYINNSLGALNPLGRRAGLSDRAAIVTRVENNKVFFTTYRKRQSWRAPKNIRRLSSTEESQLE